jgi:hypothetical protein
LRVLFQLFALAVVHCERVGDTSLTKFESQSLPMIAVGRGPNTNCLQFHNPINGSFVTSIDYKFQPHCTSGARFGYKYQPGTFIYCLDESTTIFTLKFALDSSVLVHTHSPPHKAKVIGLPHYDSPDIYTVMFSDGSISEYSNHDNILEACPESCDVQKATLLPHYLQPGANATLFLDTMPRPRHGKLVLSDTNNWSFYPGNSTDPSRRIPLPDLRASIIF